MFTDNLMRRGEPETGSIAGTVGMFGGEKGIENMLEMVWRNAASLILKLPPVLPRRVRVVAAAAAGAGE